MTMLDFVFIWWFSGVVAMVALSWLVLTEPDTGPYRVSFWDAIHPFVVILLVVIAFFFGPFAWVFWLARIDEDDS